VAVAAAVSGPLFAVDPRLGLDVFAGLTLLAAAYINVAWGIAVWLMLAMVKPTPGLQTNVLLIVLAGAWLGSLVSRRPSIRAVLPGQRFLVGVLALFLAWLTLTLWWAPDRETAWEQLRLWMIVGGLVVIVATSVNSPDQLRMIMLGVVVGGALEVIRGHGFSTQGRFTGTVGDPNDLANELLLAIVFSAALIVDRKRRLERLALLALLGIITYGFVATQSRESFLALACVVVASAFGAGQHRRAVIAMVAIFLACAGVGLAVSPVARHRVFDLGGGGSGAGGSGRTTLWLVAWRIARTHQPEGIGLNNFQNQAPRYVQQPGALIDVNQIIDEPHAVHNAYLSLLAETGIIGLMLFLAVAGACLTAGLRAARYLRSRGHPDAAWLARSVTLAGFGGLCGQFFSATNSDFRLWAVLALGPAVLGLCARGLPVSSSGVTP
jgi:O-antigen ligase